MFEYTVYRDNSPDVFIETCKEIEKMFPEAIKRKLLIDVDGSTIQTYTLDGKDIDVFDDYDIGVVFVQSEIELDIEEAP